MNFDHIPINCPFRTTVANYERDGYFADPANYKSKVNYEPNSYGGPKEDPSALASEFIVEGKVGRYSFPYSPSQDYE